MLLLVCLTLQALFLGSSALCEGCTELNLGDAEESGPKYLQWEDVFNLTLSPKYAGIHWAKSGHDAYEATEDGFWSINVKTGEKLKKYFDIRELFGMDFEVSPDEQYAILYQITKAKYRHSFYANYWLIDLNNESVNGSRPNVTVDPTGTNNVQYCGFTKTGHTVVIVAEFDVYSKTDPMATGDGAYTRHTSDGEDNVIFNGVPDWVYEEEVVASYYSNYPSPDSRFIAFSKTNAKGVQHVRFPIYGKEDYATILDYEYPKAGYKNPTIQTYMADLQDPEGDMEAYLIPTPQEVLDWGEHYLYTVSWANENTVVCEWWNRLQTKISFYQCNAARADTSCTKIFGEDSHEEGWLDWWKTPHWYFDGLNSFATLLPSNQGIEGNFKHVCLFTKEEDGTWSRKFLTSGLFDVLSVYGTINTAEKKYLFYYASYGGQMYRHVFQLNIVTAESTCLSCDGYCGYGGASFSADMTMYRLSCAGPVTPYVQLKEVDSPWINVLESNYDVEMMLRTFSLPKREYMTERIGGFDINVQRISPPDFDENSTKRYPVLVYVYGGPDSGNVRDYFPYGDQRKDFHNYLANGDPDKPSFLVYHVDVRGTIGRGDDFRFPLYRKFGVTEVEDTLDFLERISQYHYVDDARMAIWGWSYGGFLSSKVAGSGRKVVQAAIAVAPVSSFRFYDTIYTERYMGLPATNKVYDEGDCLHEAANFTGTNYLLIHGTADDNVHYTNAARLAFELVENDIQFRMHAYTDRAHSLKGLHTRRHMYTMMRDWLFDVLNMKDDYLGTYKTDF
ncbi:dipeptidyl peptidase 4-like [Bolinopsis microptera]|uniref:dipeptidyl peptidase 4-like n=1 Tax=Bolinopsis microptera TaxID=2820187 RepID=UPI00307A1837